MGIHVSVQQSLKGFYAELYLDGELIARAPRVSETKLDAHRRGVAASMTLQDIATELNLPFSQCVSVGLANWAVKNG